MSTLPKRVEGSGKYAGLTVTFIDESGEALGAFDPTTVLPGQVTGR